MKHHLDPFIDLDGVLADFDGHFMPTFGCDHTKIPHPEMWRRIDEHGNYFRELPLCDGAVDFVDHCASLNPTILTACPPSNYESVARQKIEWVREHFPGLRVLPVLSGTKHLFMQRPGAILIDDYKKNTKAWEAAGGRAILHRNFTDTREQLGRLLWANEMWRVA